ncbi:MAG: Holliday junction branch migration protein RuvA [Thermoanaerobaculia bacterium]|nr:Holliday junction branch migration protein RuvA [Thermoanaerobaculia bacterium]
MIGFLRGRLMRATPERLLVEVAGVGYTVAVSLATFSEVERRAGESVELFVHTHVREDQLALYGFASEREKELFERLITVSGIGPRLAQVVLSGLPAADLLQAIAAGDVTRLTRIPGVGKKTAERMVVELRDALQALAREAAPAPAAVAAASDDDLVAALVNLGYKPAQAEKAVGDARRETPAASFHELLPLALRRLSRA